MTDRHDDEGTPRPELTQEQFDARLAALRDGGAVDATIFSDLDRAKATTTRRSWNKLPLDVRRQLVASMNELGEENIEYNFGRALKVALRDDDPVVRRGAIEGLWEDEGEDVLAYLLEEALRDDDQAVREAALRALPHETLVVHGREDQVIPLSNAYRLLELVPRAQLHVFGRCGHWTQIEWAEDFNRLVGDFLSAGR